MCIIHRYYTLDLNLDGMIYTEMTNLKLTLSEKIWLQANCPYFKSHYLDYLSDYRFKPEQVTIDFIPSEDPNIGELEMSAAGPWVEAILWEVPLMSLLSESYFQIVDRDWDYEGQEGVFKFIICPFF